MSDVFASRTPVTPDRDWCAARDLPDLPAQLLFADGDGDGIGDLPGIRSRCPTSRPWASTRSGSAPSTRRRSPTAATTSPTTATWTRGRDPRGLRPRGRRRAPPRHPDRRDIVRTTPPTSTRVRRGARAGPGSPARERYIFRDGTGPDGSEPPADWRSHFGGSAWQRAGTGVVTATSSPASSPTSTGTHPEVRAYFEDTLRFWPTGASTGSASTSRTTRSPRPLPPAAQPAQPRRRAAARRHRPALRPREVHEIYARGGRSSTSTTRRGWPSRRRGPDVEPHLPLRAARRARAGLRLLALLKAQWHPEQFRSVITRSIREQRQEIRWGGWGVSDSPSMTCPGTPRATPLPLDTDLYAWLAGDGRGVELDEATARRRARAATLMMLALPGSAYLYQGEELGLPRGRRPAGREPAGPGLRAHRGELKGVTAAASPSVDERGPSFGFGADGSWLPPARLVRAYAVSAQSGPARQLPRAVTARRLALRRTLATDDDFAWSRAVTPRSCASPVETAGSASSTSRARGRRARSAAAVDTGDLGPTLPRRQRCGSCPQRRSESRRGDRLVRVGSSPSSAWASHSRASSSARTCA